MKKLLIIVVMALMAVSASASVGYSYDEATLTLTISGKGPMYDYGDVDEYPWNMLGLRFNYLVIEEGVTSIGDFAFPRCGLISVTLPNSLTSIGKYAFHQNSKLTTVTSKIVNPFPIDNSVFAEISSNAKLIVPKGTINKYKATGGWKRFANIVEKTGNEGDDKSDNGIYYNIKSDGSLEVTGLASWATKADILSSVTIDGKKYRVTSIGANAFKGRSDITYLSIPYSVTSIGADAFKNCGSHISVNIADPESWCKMELANEHSCPLSSAGKMLVHDKETTTIDIPETVTSIAAFTFYQCSCLKTLNIPGSVTSISSSAFEDCDYLTSLNLSEGLKTIGGSAFEGCKRLPVIKIPSTVTTIKVNAFKNCTGLTDVYCDAKKVPTTDASAFDGVSIGNVTLHVPSASLDAYKASAPWNGFKGMSQPDDGLTYTVKGDGTLEVTGLASWATKADILSSVTLNGKKYRVTSIGANAFKGRSDITYLSVPYSVTSIGADAFKNCGSHISVNIADLESWCKMELANEHSCPLSSAGKMLVHDKETTTIDIPETVTSIAAFTFYQCSCLKTLNIPGSVTSISSSAFEDCDYLTSVNLGEGLKTIGGSAFEGCKRLPVIKIPSTVTTIKVNAFKNCTGLTDVYCDAKKVPTTDASAFDGVSIGNVTLHVPSASLDAYKASAPWNGFKGMSQPDDGLTYTVKGDGTLEVTGLASWATKADILSSVTLNGKKYRVTSIGAKAFEGRSDITYLSVPNSVTSIGADAFKNCGSHISVNIADLESWCKMELANEHSCPLSSAGKMLVRDKETTTIDIPETVTSIAAFTFYQCSCLKKLNIPGSVTSISSSAFEDCDYLTSANLSEGLQKIGGSAFEGCKRLAKVTIPSTVTEIKVSAFKNCTGMEKVDCHAEKAPKLDGSSFDGVWEKAVLRVPYEKEDIYKQTSPWDKFANITHLPIITYVIDGVVYDKVQVAYGSKIVPPVVAEHEGYEFAWGDYPETMPDEDIIIEGFYVATAINGVKAEGTDADIYSINGCRTSKLQRGLNIIRQSDGKVRKVLVR